MVLHPTPSEDALAIDDRRFDLRVPLAVVELLGSRLCHELISPVGAVNNGVELIGEMGADMLDQAMELVEQSGRRAAARLRLYRIVYGAAGTSAAIGLAEAREIAEDYLAYGKTTLDWHADPDAETGIGLAKAILAVFVCATEALPQGGRVRIGCHADSLSVVAEGKGARLEAETRAALEGRLAADALTPRSVHAHFSGLILAAYGFGAAGIDAGDGQVAIRVARPS